MRRIVTGNDAAGRSRVVSDGPIPLTRNYKSVPGLSVALAWSSEAGEMLDTSGEDSTGSVVSFVPGADATRLVRLVFPPDSVALSPDFDPVGFGPEHLRNAPGLAELFEPDFSHTTPTLDYAVLVAGELHLQTDDGTDTKLNVGDVVIQNGTRHAWRNPTEEPAVLLAALIGRRTS